MIKWIGPGLLLLVVGFIVASVWVHSLLPFFSVFIIVAVFAGIIVTFVADVKESKRREQEGIQ